MKKKEDYPIVLVACKRNNVSVPGLHGQSSSDFPGVCDSKSAYRMPSSSDRHISFKCIKCGYVWSVTLGGTFQVK